MTKYFSDIIEEENVNWQENKNPLVRLFYKWKYAIAIKYAKLQKDDLILDFGCGRGWLKRLLPNYNLVGYDINPKETEIEDYTKLAPTKIFAIDVFEHIPKNRIREIIKNFKKMNHEFELITAIPTETWFWRKSRKLFGLSERVADHITPLKDILEILQEELTLVKKINFLWVTHTTKWKN